MKKAGCLGLLGFLALVDLGGGAPVKPREATKGTVEPYGRKTFVDRFEGNKRACVVAIGRGSTYLGLYVFDRFGNCVAKDDSTDTPLTCDDLAVEWYPPETGTYTIEVRNFGPYTNPFNIAIR